ncbi:MAG TPA: DivIVA domain-containing protein [Capillimicrobium sp.]|nr:DivIVA domain-containing protein [Capillimicrobium sp.]
MPLDRQAIEKRDFPIGRRGYDPAAVDAHLARLADEMEALTRQLKRRSGDSLAQAASEQVRAIVEAAEASAEEIERSAEEEAQQIRSDATRDAERTRADAIERAQGHVGRVSGATSEMLERVEAMQQELGTLIETLRTGANRVNADLTLLESNMGDLLAAANAERYADTAEAAERHDEADLPATPETEAFDPLPSRRHAESAPEFEPTTPEPAAEAEAEAGAEPAAEAGGGGGGDADVEGARLIALNMALNGQAREETARYLADNFDLPDREQLLDEVYASIEAG